MDAVLQLPKALAHRLERLAQEEGTTVDGLLGQLVSEYIERHRGRHGDRAAMRREVHFPLISAEETGVIHPVTGANIDEMFALDDFAS
jgi:hypothetical protein